MKTTFNVDEIRIALPCQARWNDMEGDERARFCRQCSKHVFNLSAMTRTQIETLVREKEGKFCGRFYRRADGRMLTVDCPSRLRHVRERLARIGGAVCALLLSLVGCSSRQTNSNRSEMGDVIMGTPVVAATNCPPEIMGRIALPNPAAPQNSNSHVLMGEMEFKPATNSTSAPNSTGAAK
jgi:hypothetical protein